MLDPVAMRGRMTALVPRLVGLVLALVLVLFAIAALADAVLVGWRQALSPGWASLAAAVTYLVLAGLVVALSRHLALRRRPRAAHPLAGGTTIFSLLADSVRTRPATALLIALAAGALLEQRDKRR